MVENKRFQIMNVLTKYSGIHDNGRLLTFDEVEDTLNTLYVENQWIKQVLDNYLNNSYKELNKFKSLKNPVNPERVRKQIIIRDAEIMLLIRIMKEIQGE